MRVNRLSLIGVIIQLTKAIALGFAKIEQGQVVSMSSGTDLLIERYRKIRPKGHNLLQAIKSV
jgi:hypothetical protein